MRRPWVGRVVAALAVVVTGALGVVPSSASAADADTAPPVLTGVSYSTTALTAPGTVTLTLDATDDVAIVRSEVTFLEDGSHRYVLVSDTSSPLTVGRYFSQGDANGTWRPYEVRLTDAAGNWTFELPGGVHVIRVTQPANYRLTTPSGGYFVINIAAGQTRGGLLFGQKRIALPS